MFLKGPAIGQSSADRGPTIGAVGKSANKKIPGGHSVNCGPLIARQLAKFCLKSSYCRVCISAFQGHTILPLSYVVRVIINIELHTNNVTKLKLCMKLLYKIETILNECNSYIYKIV